ncbi:glycoside hydrolase family 55 protein, partial [Oidiodendron maius Zn]
QVWRDVKKDYGAIGDGVADDTEAINLAIADGGRCGFGCNSSSVKGALVFFPPEGTYRVTAPIIMFYNTQIVGYIDPATGNLPTITAATTFTGLGVLSSDVYLPGGQSEWYINQSNFYRQIRNLNIDISQATLYNVAGIHWQVAQATSIQNVKIFMSDPSTSSQVGIWAENGSGGWLDGILFYQGLYGFLGGNQQYTAGNLLFYGCKNGIGLIWDWSWTWAELIFTNCGTAINLDPPGASLSDPVGSIYLMDVQFNSCGTCIYTFPFTSSEKGTTVFTFDNVNFVTNTHFMSLTNGNYLETIDVTHNTFVQFTTIGDLIGPFGEFDGTFNVSTPKRPSILTQNAAGSSFTFAQNAYYKRGKPSYSTFGIANFFNVKEAGAYGDGVHDDTTILQQMLLYCAANNYIAFFPAGSYMISSTIVIPKGSYIVGEVWSQLVAYGSDFADENNQAAMIQVGNVGDVGNIEIQDLLFTSVGQLPGLILVSWWASAAVQGSVGMWDCHFRVGGAKGTNLQVAQCPSRTAEVIASCVAASTMMVVAPNSNGYFENVWAWVAGEFGLFLLRLYTKRSFQINIWVGRGILIQSDGPSWFWGTASEHSVIYQYNIYNASNIFMSMIQTESPCRCGEHQAPFPFEISGSGEDPVFDMCGYLTTSCNVAWAIVIQGSQNIFINGAGLYSWFQNYDESCVHTSNCQQRLINIVNTANLWFNHIVTIGSVSKLSLSLDPDPRCVLR